MDYNEKLLTEALEGNKYSYKELKFNAGAGNADAQYYLAMYYAKKSGTVNGDYIYWITKAKENGNQSAIGEYSKYVRGKETNVLREHNSLSSNEDNKEIYDYVLSLLKKFSFTGKAGRLEYIISWIIALGLVSLSISIDNSSTSISIVNFLVDWFLLSQAVRRLHDVGVSGWWVLIPVISWVVIIFVKGENDNGKEKIKNLS